MDKNTKNIQLLLLEGGNDRELPPDAINERRLGRYAKLDPGKLRGGYYTPDELATWTAAWAVRTPHDAVLEPSCGDGAFLEAVARRLIDLSKHIRKASWQITGVEIVKEEAAKSKARLSKLLAGSHPKVNIVPSDFFCWWSPARQGAVSVVIGNPPFIRYQSFPEASRDRAMEIMRRLGLTPNRLTNIWVPFVVASVASLKPGGRLAMVVPAELLQVGYASQLRSFLADRFRRIDIVACNDLLFARAEQEVVLLLADDLVDRPSEKNSCRVAMTEVQSVKQLIKCEPTKLVAKSPRKEIRHDSEKWLKYFLSNREIGLMRRLREATEVTNLSSHASVDVGVVTGNNNFFLLSAGQVAEIQAQDYVLPIVARSSHIRGVRFTDADWKALVERGDRVHLLNLGVVNGHPYPKQCLEYVKEGETAGVHLGTNAQSASLGMPFRLFGAPTVLSSGRSTTFQESF